MSDSQLQKTIHESVVAATFLFSHGILSRAAFTLCASKINQYAYENGVTVDLAALLKLALEEDPQNLIKRSIA